MSLSDRSFTVMLKWFADKNLVKFIHNTILM